MLLSQLCARIPVIAPEILPEREITAIEYDSRRPMSAETLFVCLIGAHMDGHDFLEKAYERGCRVFLVSRTVEAPAGAILVQTTDTREALAVIGADFYGRPAEKLHLIGITGTKGKTSTALMIQSILNGTGRQCGYIGSNGVSIAEREYETANTTPESLILHRYFAEMVESGVEYAVIEVSSQALAHCRVHGIRFETAIFTNLSPDHIGAADGEHPDFADYMASKARLFTEHGCAWAIYNADDPMWEDVVGKTSAARLSYAADAAADFSAWNIAPYRERTALGIAFSCAHGGETADVRLLTPGEFSVHNALAAIAAVSVYGVTVREAAEILAHTPVRGRFEIVEALPERTFVIDYAHNGVSLQSALTVLRAYAPRRLICLVGSVGGRTRGRRAELAAAASALADFCILTSDNPDGEPPEEIIAEMLQYFDKKCPYAVVIDRAEAIRLAVRMSQPGDILLLAGKGHETYQLIAGEKVPFSERAILTAESANVLADAALLAVRV